MKHLTTLFAGVMMSSAAYAQHINLTFGSAYKEPDNHIVLHLTDPTGERIKAKIGSFQNEAFETTAPDGQSIFFKAYRTGADPHTILIDEMPFTDAQAARELVTSMPAFPGRRTYQVTLPSDQSAEMFSHIGLAQGDALIVQKQIIPRGW